MSNPNKRIGSAWEGGLLGYLRQRFVTAERSALVGAKDEGDLWLTHDGIPYVLELKAEKRIDLASYVQEAELEAAHWHAARPHMPKPHWAAVVKRRNHGAGKAYVVMTVDEWIRLVKR